ncbi:transcriptional regulator [Clostridia bacterium]|nr:transcriptional regulator [Clostridia bacterium]
MNVMTKTFGEYIRQLRDEKSLSQRELASKAKLSNAEISRLESGERRKPSIATIRAVSPHLGVEYTDLLLKAGYIDSIVAGNVEDSYLDSTGSPVDIVSLAKSVYKVDPDLMAVISEASSNASDAEIGIIKRFLSVFTNTAFDKGDKVTLFALLEKFV